MAWSDFMNLSMLTDTDGSTDRNSALINGYICILGNQVDILHGMSFHTSLQFTHRKLIGHIHSAFQVTTLEACFQKCLKCQEASGGACKCLSFNMKHLEAGESGRCEINTVSADNTPQDLIAFEGYQHYSVVFSSLPTPPVKQGP